MTGVLADTSVWVRHFRESDPHLLQLLVGDGVLMHSMVLGELACGTPPQRQRALADLALLQPVHQARPDEVMAFIERDKLFGQGCGWVDLCLLASVLLTPGGRLWSLDRRLCALAERVGVLYQPNVH